MDAWYMPVMKFLKSPPKRSFIIYPLIVLFWELLMRDGTLVVEPYYLVLMVWGYGQFRFSHRYRKQVGGGEPGPAKLSERLWAKSIASSVWLVSLCLWMILW